VAALGGSYAFHVDFLFNSNEDTINVVGGGDACISRRQWWNSMMTKTFTATAAAVPTAMLMDNVAVVSAAEAPSNNNNDNIPTFRIERISSPEQQDCTIQSQRNDLLEIDYEANFVVMPSPSASSAATASTSTTTSATTTTTTTTAIPTPKLIMYDSSAQRGTGQPYQMILGSGDMIPGVDLGLYDMCIGETRRLVIPPKLAYGTKGNKLFGIPASSGSGGGGTTLVWDVTLIRINGQGRQ
jgi:hypothetical protein